MCYVSIHTFFAQMPMNHHHHISSYNSHSNKIFFNQIPHWHASSFFFVAYSFSCCCFPWNPLNSSYNEYIFSKKFYPIFHWKMSIHLFKRFIIISKDKYRNSLRCRLRELYQHSSQQLFFVSSLDFSLNDKRQFCANTSVTAETDN